MTDDEFRGLVLTFPETTEGAHGALPTFLVRGRRFVTLGWPEPGKISFALSAEEQEMFIAACPDVFEPAPGAWGRRGHSHLNLRLADAATIRGVVAMAWRRSAAARKARPHR